jgi:long-chain fatty acid transport protein
MSARASLPRNPKRTLAAAGRTAVWLVALLSSTSALATEGYFQNGIGARQKALAGAGVAYSTDATAVSLNPAGLVGVDGQLNAAVSFLHLDGGFTSWGTGGLDPDGHHQSSADWVVIPNFAATWRVNWGLADAVAFSVYANGGVSTDYKDIANPNCPFPGLSGVFCGGRLGIRLAQTFFSAAFAKNLSPAISVGFAPIVARQTGEIEGVGLFSFASADPTRFSNRGTDESWGLGARGGVEVRVSPNVRVGIAGNIPIRMSNFEEYRGLLAERGGFDIPGSLQAGVAATVAHGVTLMADYKRIWYGSVASVSNPSTNLGLFPFGDPNGPGYGVRDVDVVKLGAEWQASRGLTLRAGYSYNTAPIESRDADLNIMTLGVVQHHVTGGLKYKVSERLDLELSAMYAPNASVRGVELGAPLRNVEIEMEQLEVTAGIVYRFGSRQPEPLK